MSRRVVVSSCLATETVISSRITADTINQNVKNASYAVRGPIVSRSMEINHALKSPEGPKSFPFKKELKRKSQSPYLKVSLSR